MGVVAIAMALMIAFSGVASASWLAEPAPENQTVKTATKIVDWKSSRGNLLDNPPFAFGKWEVYGNVRSGVATDFNKNFNVYTGTASNHDVTKNIGYTSKLGLLPIIPASWKEMNDKIDVGGLKEGSMAKGKISAGMSVYVVDGSDGGLGSRLSYQERSSAYGEFEFHKVIDYTSKITTP